MIDPRPIVDLFRRLEARHDAAELRRRVKDACSTPNARRPVPPSSSLPAGRRAPSSARQRSAP